MKKQIKAAVAAVVTVGAAGANAAGIDFTAMTGSVDASTVVAALVAFGAIYLGPGFAKWAVKKVSTFFG
ncbi:hypothetical protein HF909_18390 (plasmid) [Ralstonia pseudosolanacearum]|uniref:Uncharacterized protein n=1 Tax=Ralstonia solanacearum TaxID=305 RepID=A0AA92K514_RALSL|nr:hypothetical protein [Ralstonia pseudosolanacearum]QOK98454.1 hypothetical protein HF909_18390 [Ralstonia pseudosolanacearum]